MLLYYFVSETFFKLMKIKMNKSEKDSAFVYHLKNTANNVLLASLLLVIAPFAIGALVLTLNRRN